LRCGSRAPCFDDTAALAFNLLHAIVSAKAKCYFSDAKSMKAKETQEPSEHRAFELSSFVTPVTHSQKEINERRLAFEQKAIA
jgi:hypothetical protein